MCLNGSGESSRTHTHFVLPCIKCIHSTVRSGDGLECGMMIIRTLTERGDFIFTHSGNLPASCQHLKSTLLELEIPFICVTYAVIIALCKLYWSYMLQQTTIDNKLCKKGIVCNKKRKRNNKNASDENQRLNISEYYRLICFFFSTVLVALHIVCVFVCKPVADLERFFEVVQG